VISSVFVISSVGDWWDGVAAEREGVRLIAAADGQVLAFDQA